jgi:hypothetical protein
MQMVSLRERLRRFTLTWPLPMQAELKRYLRCHKVHPLRKTGEALPHFILLPTWLLERYRPKPSKCDRDFLSDVLWGQFCVYLAFRIEDDLFDHDADANSLVFAADLLQLESSRTFSLHFPRRSPFWGLYFESLQSALKAVVRADNLQRSRGGSAEMLLKEYARLCSTFKIAAAAVCVRYSGLRHIRCAGLFWDEIAIAGQLLDDLQDLDEDWRRGRSNAIVRIMLGKRTSALAGQASGLRATKRELMMGGFERILQMVLQRIDRAEDALRLIRSKAPYPGLREYRKNIEKVRHLVHRESVQLLFSGG